MKKIVCTVLTGVAFAAFVFASAFSGEAWASGAADALKKDCQSRASVYKQASCDSVAAAAQSVNSQMYTQCMQSCKDKQGGSVCFNWCGYYYSN